MIPGFGVYQTFVALKNHFILDSYDYVKYNGKSRVSIDSYLKRKDKFFFEKIGRNVSSMDELKDFIIGNLCHGANGLHINPEKIWAGDLTTTNARNHALAFMAKKQALDYYVKKDLTTIKECIRIRELEERPNGHLPFLLELYYNGDILPETIVILNSLQNLYAIWDKRLQSDPIWVKTKAFLVKYEKLVLPNIDRTKYKKLYTEIFVEKDDI
jgi:hypothetical protein